MCARWLQLCGHTWAWAVCRGGGRRARGGWFQKCQDLSYVVLAMGPHSETAQELAAMLYSGPEDPPLAVASRN